MSFEGYFECLCPEGHYWTADCYTDDQTCRCGLEASETNLVDQTNGFVGGDWILEVAESAPTCPTCGHATGPARYKLHPKRRQGVL